MSRDLAAGILGIILLPASLAMMWMIIRHKPGSPKHRRYVVPYVWTLPALGAVIMVLNGSKPALLFALVASTTAIVSLCMWLSQMRRERWDARMAKKHDVTIQRPDE